MSDLFRVLGFRYRVVTHNTDYADNQYQQPLFRNPPSRPLQGEVKTMTTLNVDNAFAVDENKRKRMRSLRVSTFGDILFKLATQDTYADAPQKKRVSLRNSQFL